MPDFTVFDADSGEILRTLSGSFTPSLIAKQSKANNQIVMEGQFDSAHFYIEGQDALDRPQLIIPEADEIEGAFVWTLTDVPDGTLVSMTLLGGEWSSDGVVEDGIIEFSTSIAGVYEFTLTPPFPWRPTRTRKRYGDEVQQ